MWSNLVWSVIIVYFLSHYIWCHDQTPGTDRLTSANVEEPDVCCWSDRSWGWGDCSSLINGPKHCRFLILCEYFITRFNPFALNHENIKSQKRRPSKIFSLNESPWDNTPLGEHLTRDSGGLGLVCHYHIVLLTSFVFQYHCS